MADWIKVETTSSQKIEVLTMADILDMDEHMVFGKLVIVWCWADANTVDGNANNVTKRMIDRVACNAGFADAMLHESVGWLKQDENGNISFSNFDRHNGKGAKKRATTARRVKEHRSNVTDSVTQINQECNAESVTKAIPEKIREDKSNNKRFVPPSAIEVQSYFEERGFADSNFGNKFVDHYEANNWMRGKTKIKDWKACVRTWINQGSYKKAQPTQSNVPPADYDPLESLRNM